MSDEQVVKSAEESTPSPLASAIASSPEALAEGTPQGTETSTPKQDVSQEQEEAKIPYSRFKEKVDEANWLKNQLEQQQRFNQPQQQQFQQPVQDPYVGMTAEEEKFFRVIDARAEKIAEQKLRQITPTIDAGRMELAQIKVQQFRAEHPDVKPNSPEEFEIARRIQAGYLPTDAYRAVMWDTKVAEVGNFKADKVKQQTETKRQANVESGGSSRPIVPLNQKLTTRQKLEQNYEEMRRKGEF